MSTSVLTIGVIFALSVLVYIVLSQLSPNGTSPDGGQATIIVAVVGLVVYGARWAIGRARSRRVAPAADRAE